MFGADAPDSDGGRPPLGRSLAFTLSLAEGFDDDALADVRPSGVTPDAIKTFLPYTTATPAIDFAWRGERLSLRGTTLSALRYYRKFDKVASLSHTAGLGLSARLFRETTLEVNQTGAYSPSYLFGLFPRLPQRPRPGDALPAAPELSIRAEESYFFSTLTTLTQPLNDGSSLSATAEVRRIDFLHENTLRRDQNSIGFGGVFSRRLTRDASLIVGYGRRDGDFHHETGRDTSEHEIEFGVDYNRPLARTRRALMSFRVGASTVDVPASDVRGLTDVDAPGRLYRLSGSATVRYPFYQFGRLWEASAHYQRAMELIAYLTEPVFVDGVHMALEGLFSRSMDVRASASYSNGESVLNLRSPTFKTYTGDVRLRYAFNRRLAIFGEYLYYFYDFRGNTRLAPGVPNRLERNAVQAGLMLWVPAFER